MNNNYRLHINQSFVQKQFLGVFSVLRFSKGNTTITNIKYKYIKFTLITLNSLVKFLLNHRNMCVRIVTVK